MDGLFLAMDKDNSNQRFQLEMMEPKLLLSDVPAVELLGATSVPDAQPRETGDEVAWLFLESTAADSQSIPSLLDAAVEQLSGLGFSPEQLEKARDVQAQIADLPGWTLAEASSDGITIDREGGGYGWFIDPSPADAVEFTQQGKDLQAVQGSPAEGRLDLLTVLTHELGHYLGLENSDGSEAATAFMQSGIRPGIRRLPATIASEFQQTQFDGRAVSRKVVWPDWLKDGPAEEQ